MEMVLEHAEVVALVCEGLRRRGVDVPEGTETRIRVSNKQKQSIRLVLIVPVVNKEQRDQARSVRGQE